MYDVALLIETQLSELDARQVVELHEGLDETVTYHVLIPVDDAAAALSTSLGVLGGADMSMPAVDNISAVDDAVVEAGREELDASIALLTSAGAEHAEGSITREDPVDALAQLVDAHDAAEAIILTNPHVVSEFFHLDWTSRARRHLNVPTLHLLERENFDEQAGGGEGASLF